MRFPLQTTPFADFLPRPQSLISISPGERSIQPRCLLYRVPQTPKRAQNMRQKEILLCAWPFEGISREGPFMDASTSIQRLMYWLRHHKRQRRPRNSLIQTFLLTLQLQDEEILSDCCFGPCGSGNCKSVQLPAGRNCDCDSRRRTFDPSFKFRSSHECSTPCGHHGYRWPSRLHDDFDHERVRKPRNYKRRVNLPP